MHGHYNRQAGKHTALRRQRPSKAKRSVRRLIFMGALFAMGIPLLHSKPAPAIETPVAMPAISELIVPAAAPIVESVAPQHEWTVKPNENFAKILSKLKLSPALIPSLMRTKEGRLLGALMPGEQLAFFLDDATAQIKQIAYHPSAHRSIFFNFDEAGAVTSETLDHPMDTVVHFRQGVIEDSLFLDGKKAGLSDKLILSMADLFAWDIDFALDLRPGDSFSLLFENHYRDGQPVDEGNIIMAEFSNKNKTYKAIRFEHENGKASYYTPEGYSLQKAFIRTPLKFTRISSHFNLKRKHPVLHKIRAHRGTDYAAPRGTPVKAAGDGKVIFSGRKGGYGNVIEIQHGSRYNTVYAHLNHFNKRSKVGRRVKQGDIIGYVGSSGLATGPHLHYEFKVNGTHRNPPDRATAKVSAYRSEGQAPVFCQSNRNICIAWAASAHYAGQ